MYLAPDLKNSLFKIVTIPRVPHRTFNKPTQKYSSVAAVQSCFCFIIVAAKKISELVMQEGVAPCFIRVLWYLR